MRSICDGCSQFDGERACKPCVLEEEEASKKRSTKALWAKVAPHALVAIAATARWPGWRLAAARSRMQPLWVLQVHVNMPRKSFHKKFNPIVSSNIQRSKIDQVMKK